MSILPTKRDSKGKEDFTDSDDDSSAHSLRSSSPWEAGFNLFTANNSPYVLGYPVLLMPALGWTTGTIVLAAFLVLSIYSNVVLARLNMIDGVRYYRYPDLSRRVFGPFGYWFTFILQWTSNIGSNVGGIVLAGESLKGFCEEAFNLSEYVLWQYILVSALILAGLAIIVPDMHNLRLISAITSLFFLAYCAIFVIVATYDGSTGTPAVYTEELTVGSRILGYFTAFSTAAYAYNTVLIPEIQGTIKGDPVGGYFKAMLLSFGGGAPLIFALTLVSFWAYGVDLDSNILSNLSGPSWALASAWLAVFIQQAAVFQLYCTPLFEAMDSSLYDMAFGPWAPYNVAVRVSYRVPYIFISAFFAALLPFFGDFASLIGALSILPLNFILPFLMHLRVDKGKISSSYAAAHWFLVGVLAVITAGSTIASINDIIVASVTYSLFANV